MNSLVLVDSNFRSQYRDRWYSPETSMFISEDPVRIDGGLINFYSYVGANPLRYIDPFGLRVTHKPISLKQFRKFLKTKNGCRAQKNWFKSKGDQKNRFVQINGVVYDMRHVKAAYDITKALGGGTLGAMATLAGGYVLETVQYFGGAGSASGSAGSGFSKEDTPSNSLGAAMGTGSGSFGGGFGGGSGGNGGNGGMCPAKCK